MDKEDSLAIARKVRAQKSQDRKKIEERIQEIRKATCELVKCKPEDVDVHLYGYNLEDHVSYVWDRDEGVALAYHIPLV